MGRPVQDVRIFQVQDRRRDPRIKKPWVVRRRVDGKQTSTSFATRALADRYRSRLLLALEAGERFDRQTGEPVSWLPGPGDIQLHAWVRRWISDQWHEWAPRTRHSALEAMSRFVPLVRGPDAPAPPDDLRAYLVTALRPGAYVDPEHPHEQWLRQWSMALSDLNRDLLGGVDKELGMKLDGSGPLAPSTAGRYRKSCRSCIRRAVELERIPSDPWPPRPKGTSRRKVNRQRRAVDVRRLPAPPTMARAIKRIRSHQPGSQIYQLMTAVAYYGGLRPSEVVMLRPRALVLPESGWGRIEVVEADVDYDESGEPKEGDRSVPIPPVLVAMLRAWITERKLGPDDLLFRTRNDRRPAPSNWTRALKRAFEAIGHAPISPPESWHLDWERMTRPGNLDAQFALFSDYANHVARFDELAEYHQDHQPSALVLWGRRDPYFDVDEVLAYHRVLERMEAHIYDGGHLLLETHAAECADLMRTFVLDNA
jgi:integrase